MGAVVSLEFGAGDSFGEGLQGRNDVVALTPTAPKESTKLQTPYNQGAVMLMQEGKGNFGWTLLLSSWFPWDGLDRSRSYNWVAFPECA